MYIFWLEALTLLGLVSFFIFLFRTDRLEVTVVSSVAFRWFWSLSTFTIFMLLFSVSDILRAFAALLDALTFQYYPVDGGLKKSELHEHRAHFQRDRKTGRLVYRPHQIMYYFIKVHEKKPRRFVCMEYLPLDDGRYYTFIVGRFSSVIVDVLDKDGNSLWPKY